jgi:hypothetical protein
LGFSRRHLLRFLDDEAGFQTRAHPITTAAPFRIPNLTIQSP